MIRRPPRSTSTSPLFPYTTLFLPTLVDQIARLITAGGQIVIDRHAAVPGLAFLRIVIGDQRHAPELPAGIVVVGHQRQPAVLVDVQAALAVDVTHAFLRSEERRVGKGWGSTCRSRWSPEH